MTRLIPAFLLALAIATPLVLSAPGAALAAPTDEQLAAIEERLAEARARLDLTDEQAAAIEPIVADSLAQQRAVLERYGIDPESRGSRRGNFRTLRRMRSEMEAIRADTLAQLQGILTAEQLDEFSALQEERRAELRERVRGAY